MTVGERRRKGVQHVARERSIRDVAGHGWITDCAMDRTNRATGFSGAHHDVGCTEGRKHGHRQPEGCPVLVGSWVLCHPCLLPIPSPAPCGVPGIRAARLVQLTN